MLARFGMAMIWQVLGIAYGMSLAVYTDMTNNSKRMTSKQAREWIVESSTIDDDELDAALIALGYDPDYLRGDADDPTDRRWDTACAEVADAQAQDDGEEQA